jgi:hypothetical protein
LFTLHWRRHRIVAAEIATELFKNPTWSYEECKSYIDEKLPDNMLDANGTMAVIKFMIKSMGQEIHQEKEVENTQLSLKK